MAPFSLATDNHQPNPTQAIEADPLVPWGYERRHAALHGVQRYGEAVTAFTRMLSLIEDSCNQSIRGTCI